MANTLHGPFVKGASLATGSYGTGVGQSNTFTSGNANNDETQAGVALASFNPDLVSAGFILSGVACVKDATTASQLNITSGAAYLVMTDGTSARIDVAATSESATGHASSTLYLDLNPDGTWSWGTTHSAQANYLPICQVTTDGSSNIATVTDKRITLVQLLSGATHPSVAQPGGVQLPAPLEVTLTQSIAYMATVTGGVTFAQVGALRGAMDGAATFNGSTGYLTTNSTSLPSGNSAFTLEGWFKTSMTGANQIILALGGFAAKTAGLLYVNSSNKLDGDLFSSSISSGATVTDGAWHHAVFTWDGTNGNLYLDGALVAGPTALGPNNLTAGQTVYIGAQNFGSIGGYFNGTLDEVAIYGAALSSTRVTAHYNAGSSTTSDGYAAAVLADSPLRYYRLGDASGASVAACTISPTAISLVDAAGNGYLPSLTTPGDVIINANSFFQKQWDASVSSWYWVLRILPSGTGVNKTWEMSYNSASGEVQFYNDTDSQMPLSLGPGTTGNTAVANDGHFGKLAGQATVGSFGVPVIVAQALGVHVTATTQQTILSFTPPATGLYRVSFYGRLTGANPSVITAQALWTDPSDSSTQFSYFTLQTSSAGHPNPLTLDAASTPTGNVAASYPLFIYAKSGGTINVSYTNSTATPNDFVSAMIERLS